MLLVRLASKPERIPRFGRILSDAPTVVELLDGDPLAGHAEPTGERLPYTPDEWQADPDGSTIELLTPMVPQKIIGVGSVIALKISATQPAVQPVSQKPMKQPTAHNPLERAISVN